MASIVCKQNRAEKMVCILTEVLRLNEWNIIVEVMDSESYQAKHDKSFGYATDGCTEVNAIRKEAHVYIKESLKTAEFESTIIHELIHLVTFEYDHFIRTALESVSSKSKRKRLTSDALWEMEIAVSRFTTILKPLLAGEFQQL